MVEKKRSRSRSQKPKGRDGKKRQSQDNGTTGTSSKSVPLHPKPKAVPPYMGMPLAESDVIKYQDNDEFEKKVKRCVPSEFVLIASQDGTSKAQEDYNAMEHFQIRPPKGKTRWLYQEQAGSVATCALLQLMYEHPKAWVAKAKAKQNDNQNYFTTEQILHELQHRIKKCSHQNANPTISSSRPLGPPRLPAGVYAPYYVVPPKYIHGTRRALLIGVVTGEGTDLKGPINDIKNIQRFLINHCGFLPQNITLLLDTQKVPPNQRPTKKNILNGWKHMIQQSEPYDVNFIQFSGHGNRDSNNLYIMPSDYKKNGYIEDDTILNELIKAMPRHVYTTFLVDCCYSGTVGELPYILKASGGEQELQSNFDTTKLKTTKKAHPEDDNDKTNSSNHSGLSKRRRRPTQTIEPFYDMDTKDEAKAKEAQAAKDEAKKNKSKLLKKARKLKRNLIRFAETIDKGVEKALAKGKDDGSKSDDDKQQKAAEKKKATESANLLLSSTIAPLKKKKAKRKDGTGAKMPIRNNNKQDKLPLRRRPDSTLTEQKELTTKKDGSKKQFKQPMGVQKVAPSAKGNTRSNDAKGKKPTTSNTNHKNHKESDNRQSFSAPIEKVKRNDGKDAMKPIHNSSRGTLPLNKQRPSGALHDHKSATPANRHGKATPNRDWSKSRLKQRKSKTSPPASALRSK
ncbi:Metacaspase-1 [Seminavis robusta]|uniref:Metacaspase-1 n=1 Tax=Seminavis robusta TaxID=568900 RepID=A0A9N8HG90_9STRA|nr:Metacaspase-1 [Seminavis robusta]|eukprot:Sro564_g167370.1 Metacaspase-1 (681) ;mRNA; f:29550-31592